MYFYWLMLALFSTGALLWQRRQEHSAVRLGFYFSIVLAMLMVGLRWQIGPDWETYSFIYNSASQITFDQVLQRHDPGFYLLAWTLDSNHAPFWMLNLVMAAILCFGLAAFCRRLPNPWLAVTVAVPYLIIVVGMNLIRQAAAMGFVFLAFQNVGSKPLWKSLGWALVASLFHASAIIVAFLIGVSYTKSRITAALLMVIFAVPAYYILFSTFDDYFQRYGHQLIDSGGVYFRLVINAIPAVLLFVFKKRGIVPKDEYVLWRNIALLSLLLLPVPLFIRSTTSVDRASMYAIPLQLLVLSSFPRTVSITSARSVNTAAIVLYSAITLLTYFSFGTHARYFVPYRSIFSS